MAALFKFGFKWSLELTGLSILCYHYQSIPNQQKIQAFYHFSQNTYHLLTSLHRIKQQITSPNFTTNSTEYILQLCKKNGGVYAKLLQLLAEYKQIIPSDHLQILQGINKEVPQEIPYASIKETLAFAFQKEMKDVFDGFQIKPFKCSWLSQSHKAILLENYKQAIVKIILPYKLFQYEYDIWFLNKLKPYILSFLKQKGFSQTNVNLYVDLLDSSEKSIKQQLDLQKQVDNANKYKQLALDNNSSFYLPHYYQTWSNRYATTRQFIQGISLVNRKGLQEIGLNTQLAYSYVLSQVHRLIRKYQLINANINEKNILIRRYIKRRTVDDKLAQNIGEVESKPKKMKLIPPPPYQVVFLNLNNFTEIKGVATDRFLSYWNQMKNKKGGLKLSVPGFHGFSKGKDNNRTNYISDKLYLYEPLIRLFQKITTPTTPSPPTTPAK